MTNTRTLEVKATPTISVQIGSIRCDLTVEEARLLRAKLDAAIGEVTPARPDWGR